MQFSGKVYENATLVTALHVTLVQRDVKLMNLTFFNTNHYAITENLREKRDLLPFSIGQLVVEKN